MFPIVLAACTAGAEPEALDGRDDSFSDGKADSIQIDEGSCDAQKVLWVVNNTPQDWLDDDAGLDSRAAANIVAYRRGHDGRDGTDDDNPFDSLAELDAVPYVGPVALRRLFTGAQTLELAFVCEAECPPVVCTLFCEHGFQTGADGCEICTCVEERACGGIAGLACADTDYCDYPDDAPACGAADHTGACRPRPGACTANYDPVCGCNGETYSNACVAASSGVDVASEGACAAPPDCRTTGCADTQYCTNCFGHYTCIPRGAIC